MAVTGGSRLKHELLAQERAYFDAVRTKDESTILRLTADGCLVTDRSGIRVIDGRTVHETLESAGGSTARYEIDESRAEAVAVTDEVAVLSYRLRTASDGGTPAETYDTTVWLRANGGWLCAAHTETLVAPAQ
jgi:ketosteroid isomerase-like protein